MAIQDSGNRREFPSGAKRDIDETKGRCDLMPLVEVGLALNYKPLCILGEFIWSGDMTQLAHTVLMVGETMFGDIQTAMLEVSQHYREGAEKYGERNWEKGIPAHSYVDSAARHMIKWLRGDKDERHDRAALWNLLGLEWTIHNKPDLVDLPYTQNHKDEKVYRVKKVYNGDIRELYELVQHARGVIFK